MTAVRTAYIGVIIIERGFMNISDFAAKISALSPEELLKETQGWLDNGEDIQSWLKELAEAGDIEAGQAELAALRPVLLFMAVKKDKRAFAPIIALLGRKWLLDIIKPDDWIIVNLHRILGSVASPENDLQELENAVFNAAYTEEMREQCFLALHFMWLEKKLNDENTVEVYRELLKRVIDGEQIGERMALALVLNSAVVGGTVLEKDIKVIIDKGFLGEQGEMIEQAIPIITANPQQYRKIYNKEHKGFFQKMEDDIPVIHLPVVEQIPEMPGKGKTITREAPKIGRNDPCPCGSGKKYKKCCGK